MEKTVKSKSFIILICNLFISCCIYGQLPLNTNFVFGNSTQGSTQGTNSEDWIYGVKSLGSGDFLTTGYSESTSGTITKNPTATLYDNTGNVIWEQKYSCILGIGIDIYDTPNGFIIIGRGTRFGSCADPISFFSILIDKSTGAMNQSYGIKLYNHQTLPFPPPQNGAVHTLVLELGEGKPRSCEIKNSNGQLKGFMICGNIYDNSFPPSAGSNNVTTASFLLEIDLNGMPVTTFGNYGLQIYYQNTSSQWYSTHFHNVCVNYDIGGNPVGYAVVGSINENSSSAPQSNGNFGNDALFLTTDAAGNITFEDVFDETSRLKNTITPISYIYTDNADNSLCTNFYYNNLTYLNQENSNERATRIKQISNGGDFILLTQFDFTYYGFHNSSPCANTYPSVASLFIAADPAIIRINRTSMAFTWTQNLYQSTGLDFENSLIVSGNDAFILGSTMQEPSTSTPTDQRAVLSKVSISGGGTITYEQVYDLTPTGASMICPFSFDIDAGAGLIIAGDDNLNNDNYHLIFVSPR